MADTVPAALADLTLRLHADNNVVITMSDIAPGRYGLAGGGSLDVTDEVPRGHKVAAAPSPRASPSASTARSSASPASPSSRASTSTRTTSSSRCSSATTTSGSTPARRDVPESARATFQGIVRPDGRAATRNYIGIITTVNCSATVGEATSPNASTHAGLRATTRTSTASSRSPTARLRHGRASGEGYRRAAPHLAGYARHPNFAGVLVIGLGCEANQIDALLVEHGRSPTTSCCRVHDDPGAGGTRKTVEAGHRRASRTMLPPTPTGATREPIPAQRADRSALQCGGSDGYSGITANPALGAASDLLVPHGGTADPVAETPEIYGAEHLLTRRAVSQKVGEKLVERINWWEGYTGQQRRRDRQQPLARQQGRRPDDDPREVAGRGRQGRHHQPGRRRRVRRAGHGEGLRLHGHARATTR